MFRFIKNFIDAKYTHEHVPKIAYDDYLRMNSKNVWALLLKWIDFSLIPAWIINHMLSEVWDEITYPFPNRSLGMDK